MKVIIAVLALIFAVSARAQTPKFVEQVVSLEDTGSDYFVPLRVKSKTFSGSVVVPVFAVSGYLKAARGLSRTAARPLIASLIQKGAELEIQDAVVDSTGHFLTGKGMTEHTFMIVQPSPVFDAISSKGCEKLIDHYFAPSVDWLGIKERSGCKNAIWLNGDNLFMRPRLDLTEQSNVILALFKLDIPVHVDDISGSINIAYTMLK